MLPRPRPTFSGFLAFITNNMQIPANAIPPSPPAEPWALWCYDTSLATVNCFLRRASGPIYLQAVYNLAGDFLVQWTPDVPGVLYPRDNPEKLGYFAYLRKSFNVGGFVPGVVNASADENTSMSLDVPDFMKGLTLSDLQNLKTPWGRAYLAIAQKTGTLWGLS